jgi:hypothetical protein
MSNPNPKEHDINRLRIYGGGVRFANGTPSEGLRLAMGSWRAWWDLNPGLSVHPKGQDFALRALISLRFPWYFTQKARILRSAGSFLLRFPL